MIIDCHNHILAAGEYPGYEKFIKEMTLGYFRSMGKLPVDRMPVDSDWEGMEYLWAPTSPEKLKKDHPGIDRCTILAVAPSDYTAYSIRGSIDVAGQTNVPGPPSIDKGNDYIADIVKSDPNYFIGFCAVNPKYKGVDAAVRELDRAINELGLTGLKLYPSYDHYSPDDRELAFPIFEKAQELGIPVMVHQSSTPVIDAPLKFGRPFLLDDVGCAFPNLKLLACHAGAPWVDECLVLAAKHPNFYIDISFYNSLLSAKDTLLFLHKCVAYGLPLAKVCWGTDYPGFEMPRQLLEKFMSINQFAKELGVAPISQQDMDGLLGQNYLNFISR
ncbi:MAG: amidohydrolase family protein [Christensenellales bacterium]